MAYADYDIYTTTCTVALDTVTVIAGASSLQLLPGASGGKANVIATTSGAYDVGALTVGRMRIMLQERKGVLGSGAVSRCGLVAMQSQRDLRTAGTCYFACLGGTSGTLVQLYRNSAGIGTLGTQLGSAAFTAGFTPKALELQWILNLTELLGVDLTVRTGADFATMTDKIHLIDLVSAGAPTTSVGQGIGFLETNSGWETDWRMDTHEVYGPP